MHTKKMFVSEVSQRKIVDLNLVSKRHSNSLTNDFFSLYELERQGVQYLAIGVKVHWINSCV